MKKIRKHLALFCLIFILSSGYGFTAGIPVFDASNMVQTTITAFENVNQTITQLQQYAAQLQQLEDQIRNTAAPAAFLWSEADRTIQRINALQGQVMDIYSSVNNLDSYLQKFGDVNFYRGSPFFSAEGGTKEQLMAGQTTGLELQKMTTEAAARTLQQQQEQMRADGEQLRQLSATAQTAEGRMAALQYANQFASLQNGQLLQLRATVQAMHQATVAKQLTEQDAQALDTRLRRLRFPRIWSDILDL